MAESALEPCKIVCHMTNTAIPSSAAPDQGWITLKQFHAILATDNSSKRWLAKMGIRYMLRWLQVMDPSHKPTSWNALHFSMLPTITTILSTHQIIKKAVYSEDFSYLHQENLVERKNSNIRVCTWLKPTSAVNGGTT